MTPTCAEEGCDRPGVVELHVPWDENRVVCAPHARVLGQRDGVVADPLDAAAEHLVERERE